MQKKYLYQLSICLLGTIAFSCGSQKPVESSTESSEAYVIYPDRVEQGSYEARALSPTEMTSNYQSEDNKFVSPRVDFKFSINGKDNELPSGKDHHFNCISKGGVCTTPVIKFGQQMNDTTKTPANAYLQPNTELKISLDMRHVFEEFDKQGFFTTFDGSKIYKQDFKGVFIAGGTAPLVWDFDNLVNFPQLELKDQNGDKIYEITLRMNAPEEKKSTAMHWTLSEDISSFPQYSSDYTLQNALYNLSLEEMLLDIEEDSTFRTGKEWAGVWTRDISYSIILSMAVLQPKVSKYSLMRKVKNDRIVQDTGTGGAYPISTDRIVWAVAAWEIYKVTGEQEWLKQSYKIIRNSMEDDLKNAYDKKARLFRGESSFLDWREQTYPDWMQPVDIYESLNLGTNAVFYQANVILSEMAEVLGDRSASEKYSKLADNIKEGINEALWMPEKGYYGQYLYGRNFKILSPKSEALGGALTVLFDIADTDQQLAIVSKTPVTTFGIPSIFPQIPNIPPYHNNGIWPFVQSFWSLAAAKAGNEKALMESLDAIYRPAALFLTNKENFVASSGDYAGTQINSDQMLWSLAGNLGMIYKVIFGLEFQPDGLVFRPFVPKKLKGKRTLLDFNYRNAVLSIEMEGYGNQIASFTLDGESQENFEIPADLKGNHVVKIVLANNEIEGNETHHVPVHFSPESPKVSIAGKQLSWNVQEGVAEYKVLRNGETFATTAKTSLEIRKDLFSEYQVIAIGTDGYESFASEPLKIVPENRSLVFELETITSKSALPYKGFSGDGFIEISKTSNKEVRVDLNVTEDGLYAIDFHYANGNGPINTNNKAAIRTLKKGNDMLGTIVLPQRGNDEWSDWGYTNAIKVELKKGNYPVTLSFEPANENMNGAVNQAMLDYMRVIRIN